MMKEGLIPDRSVIPIPESKRVSTDVICTIIGALFALTLFVLACIFYKSGKCSSMQTPSTQPTTTSPAPQLTPPLPPVTITTVSKTPSGP
jgi:hypothetical protein